MCRVKDKITMITGGASGIGRACCLLFAGEGATVHDVSREDECSW